MRKIIAILLLLACLLTAIFMVGCEKKASENTDQGNSTVTTPQNTPAFSGSAYDALKQLKADGTIQLDAGESTYGAFLNSVTYAGVTIANNNASGKYIGVFINTDDVNLIDLYGTCDPITLGNETYNYSGVGIDAITYKAGLKVLITLTEDVGNYHYAPVKGKALIFELPSKVEVVACPAFSGSAYDALKQLRTAGTIQFDASESTYGAFLNSISYSGVTIANNNATGKYIGVFINTDDVNLIDLYGTCDSVTYGGETYNYSGVGIDAIPYKEGLKVLIALTEDAGNYHYAAVRGSILVFDLPYGVEAKTLN